MSADTVRAVVEAAEAYRQDPPRPLTRELPPPTPFPVDELGPVLGPAALAIRDMTQAPLAMCGASVLAAAALAVQPHADAVLPTRQPVPLSLFLLAVGSSGERKTGVDRLALRAVKAREADLREAHGSAKLSHGNAKAAWEAATDQVRREAKGADVGEIRRRLDALGPPPPPPLDPTIICADPTIEGIYRLLAEGQPSAGLFSAEGGMFIGGHAMSEENRLRTAAGLSALWDGEPIKRVRAKDGTTVLPGRRASLYLMVQPEVAAQFIADPLLNDQGLMGRVLVTAPDTTAGTRLWKEPLPRSDVDLEVYDRRLAAILSRPLPLVEGTTNELRPRRLDLSPDARNAWIAYHDHIERRIGVGAELAGIRPLANKAAEHAARIAGVLTLIGDPDCERIDVDAMCQGTSLVDHFLAEAIRLDAAGRVPRELRTAQRVLDWLQRHWRNDTIALQDLYQKGPTEIRNARAARSAVRTLEDHGYLRLAPGGGDRRKEVWRVVR